MTLRQLARLDAFTPPAWMKRANCVGEDPDKWFPGPGADTSEAYAICRACDVRRECLDYALRNKEDHGIWGGVSERGRRQIRRQRRNRSVA